MPSTITDGEWTFIYSLSGEPAELYHWAKTFANSLADYPHSASVSEHAEQYGSIHRINLRCIFFVDFSPPDFHGGGNFIIIVIQLLGQQMKLATLPTLTSPLLALSTSSCMSLKTAGFSARLLNVVKAILFSSAQEDTDSKSIIISADTNFR